MPKTIKTTVCRAINLPSEGIAALPRRALLTESENRCAKHDRPYDKRGYCADCTTDAVLRRW